MRAICFQSVQNVATQSLADPTIQDPLDAIVQVEMAGLCGSDLHPYFGREEGLDPGTVMGHEFVGHIIAIGDQVEGLSTGDRVMAPFTTNCGKCRSCRAGLTSRCDHSGLFGWRQNGRGLHGGQAEQVRVPLAPSTLVKISDDLKSETALLLGDNLSTGCFANELADVRPGGTYAVIGCGTVGLLAVAAAVVQAGTQVVAVDPNPARLAIAKSLGAIPCSDDASAERTVKELTDGLGVDSVMEMVGLPAAQSLAYRLVRPGGTLAVIGCHCTPHFAFSPAEAYDKNLTYRTGRCPARRMMGQLLDQRIDRNLDLDWCITHRFSIDQAVAAYDTFANGRDQCIKAVIEF